MIDGRLIDLYGIAASRSAEAVKRKDPEAAKIANAQMGALLEIIEASKAILERRKVPDLELEGSRKPTLNKRADYSRLGKKPEQPLTLEQLEPLSLGQALKRLRVEAGLSQEDLARASTISQVHIQKVEQGKTGLGVGGFEQIANGLRYSEEDWRRELLHAKVVKRAASNRAPQRALRT
ncbi:helix-turn-helix transcriptional regulator [Candidatus Daviesbacteria bacterium]|nr:helix-turn-helix transcriptional regulator [Candidatus Daviesbacteria bacterium]